MKKVLFVLDRENWAYHTKAEQLKKNYKGSDIEFRIISKVRPPKEVKDAIDWADLLLLFGFQNFRFLEKKFQTDPKKALVSIASHASWDKGKTQPNNHPLPSTEVVKYLKRFKGVSAVSYRLQLLFRFAGLRNTVYTPNGVPLDMFTPSFRSTSTDLVCGYAGRDKDQKKGNRSIIEPAVQAVQGVDYRCAMCDFQLERSGKGRGNTYLDYKSMPSFYKRLDVYLVASREEGSCRSLLESMACGCAPISTDCGATNELIVDGWNGLVVDRTPKAFARAIKRLRDDGNMLQRLKKNAVETAKGYDWKKVSNYWYNWIESKL